MFSPRSKRVYKFPRVFANQFETSQRPIYSKLEDAVRKRGSLHDTMSEVESGSVPISYLSSLSWLLCFEIKREPEDI
jgi:hypothetical protein